VGSRNQKVVFSDYAIAVSDTNDIFRVWGYGIKKLAVRPCSTEVTEVTELTRYTAEHMRQELSISLEHLCTVRVLSSTNETNRLRLELS